MADAIIDALLAMARLPEGQRERKEILDRIGGPIVQRVESRDVTPVKSYEGVDIDDV